MKWENTESVETTTVRTMTSGPILLSSQISRYHDSGLFQHFLMSFGDHTIEDKDIALATWPTAAIARARVALDQFEAALMEDQVDG